MYKYIFSLLIVAAAMLLATPGTEARFYIDIPGVETNCIPANTPLTINVKMNNITGENVIGMANGFRIYSPEGAVWQVPTVSSEIGDYFDLVFAINGFSVDGSGADTIGLTGVAVTAPGVPNGYDDVVLVINTQVEESEIGKTFCIDSSWFPPMGSWQWVTPSGTVIPEWEGPYCYIIYPSLATIEGTVFYDADADGVWDQLTETGMPGVTVNLTGTATGTEVTGSNGEYSFTDLAAGTYRVFEDVPPGYVQTCPTSVVYKFVTTGYAHHTSVDFGNTDDTCETEITTDTCFAGTYDDFVGAEPSSPDAALLAWMDMATSGANPYFDSACVNQSFGHTFEGCWPESCWVIGATLCMKLKATGVIPHTDKLYLGEWDGIGASWAIELNDLENFAGGTGPWSSGDVMTVCLDLANLPAAAVGLPQNILAGLRDGRLDVLISDDTEVDYLELIVEICCPYGSICGTKFNDLNGNGIQDVGEEGLPNWTITLDDEDQSYTQVTGPNGEYCFTELASGHYSVYEMNQAGWTQMYPHFEKYEIDLPTSGTSDWAVEDVDFGNYFCETEITTDTCFAGAYDDFVGAEPSSPDAALLEVMGTLSSGANPYFDSVCINQGFGHTFSCWPESCQVVGATLCMRLKATGVIPHTDKLYLGEWDGIGAFWAIELNDLEDLAGGTGPWSSGDVMTVCLDLANLPATGLGTLQNLLGELQAGRLDVLIQDDTEVDYLELIVETCCEATVPDHGVIIVEPSGPGAGEGDTLYCDEPLTFDIHLRNHYDTTIMAIANGFRLYSPDGATWETPVYNSTGSLEPYLDFGVWVNGFSVDGVSDDTISLGGLAAYNGIPNGFDAVVMTIGTRFDESQAGKTVCIDSTFFPPIGTWMWACTGGSLIPDWGGPYCWTIADPDACCVDDRGNVDGDPDDIVDISDLTYLVDYMFTGGPPPPCPKEADLNGDGGVDIADLVYFVDYMFTGGPAPVPCDYMPPPAKVSGQQADISFDIEYANGISTVVMNSPIDLRGIQLELKGTGPAPANLVGEHVDMIHGRDGWVVKVGLLDLDGGEIISADTREVVRFEGKYTLEAVIVADVNARSITPTIGSVLKQNELPAAFTLSQNYPNPFNPSTSINFALPEAAEVRLEVFNLLGQRVTTLIDQRLEAGNHTAEWNSQNELGQTVASGVYFYRLETPRFTESKKMVLLK